VGLGLVRRIVQQYGGQVAVDSQPGQGAEFTFTLPNTRIECRNAPRPTGKRVDHVSE
jgi:signal transduction histidine kinase